MKVFCLLLFVGLICFSAFSISCSCDEDENEDDETDNNGDDDSEESGSAPKIFATEPESGETELRLKAPVKIYFTQKMDQVSVKDAFSCNGAADEIVEGSFAWNEQGDTLTFTPDQTYPNAGSVEIKIDSGASNEDGIQMEEPYSFAFTTMNLWSLKYTDKTGAGREIAIDSDDNIYFTGSYVDENYYYDIFLWKLDKDGNFLWQQMWGESYLDYAYALSIDNSGDLIVAGYTRTVANGLDILIQKYDPDGQQIWSKTYDFSSTDDFARDVDVDSDGNIYVTGKTQLVNDIYHMAVLKTDSDGNLMWKKSESLIETFDESRGFGIMVMENLGVLVAGSVCEHYSSVDHYSEALLIHYSSSGNKEYQIISGQLSHNDSWFAVHVDHLGRAYVAGHSYITGSPADYFSELKEIYPELGLDKWSLQMTSHAQFIGNMTSVIGGTIYLAGNRGKDMSSPSKAWIAKVSSGSQVWDLDLGMGMGFSVANDVAVDSEGWIYSTGYMGSSNRRIWVRKCDPDGYCGRYE